MPLSGLTAASEYPSETRYRERRAPPDRLSKPEARPLLAPPAAVEPADIYDAAFYGRRFKTDLSQLRVFDGADEPPPQPDAESDSLLIDFFGHLSVLLVAVRAGDIVRAQAAADALELDALVERNGSRQASDLLALLGDLVVLMATTPVRDDGALRAVRELAHDLQSVAAVAPPGPYGEEADSAEAAYETLTHYLDGGVGSV